MHAIFQKLQSRRGASMLMALLFFLLAAMVGAVILAAASANADKLANRKQEQQDYLTISSAARFLQDTIADTHCEAAEYEQVYHCPVNHSDMIPGRHPNEQGIRKNMTVTDDDAATVIDGDGKLQTALANLANTIFLSQTTYAAKEPLPGTANTVTAKFTIEAEEMKPVLVELTMEKNYDLLLRLTMKDSPYLLILNVPNEHKQAPTSATGSSESCKHSWTETDPITGDSTTVTGTFAIDETVLTTTVKWGRGTIGKGVSTGA
ncbi:MAG: hypothetical protein RR295_05960 [Oscillospiraceae bacterium]